MPIPAQMRAVEASAPGPLSTLKVVSTRAVPHPRTVLAGEAAAVLVRVKYAALNPADIYMVANGMFVNSWPTVYGCDMAGVVAAAPAGSKFKEGDEVFAFTDFGEPHCGTFAEYCSVPEDILAAVPAGMPLRAASTLGLGTLTAAAGLFDHLSLQPTTTDATMATRTDVKVLVYGASSSVGQYAVQLAKLAGCRVVAVASSKHHAFLKDTLGADAAVDYNDNDWVAEVASDAANKGLSKVFHAAGANALQACIDVIGACGGGPGQLTTTFPPPAQPAGLDTKDVKTDAINLATAYKDQRQQIARHSELVAAYLAAGKLVPNRTKEYDGLESVASALEALPSASGEKFVINV